MQAVSERLTDLVSTALTASKERDASPGDDLADVGCAVEATGARLVMHSRGDGMEVEDSAGPSAELLSYIFSSLRHVRCLLAVPGVAESLDCTAALADAVLSLLSSKVYTPGGHERVGEGLQRNIEDSSLMALRILVGLTRPIAEVARASSRKRRLDFIPSPFITARADRIRAVLTVWLDAKVSVIAPATQRYAALLAQTTCTALGSAAGPLPDEFLAQLVALISPRSHLKLSDRTHLFSAFASVFHSSCLSKPSFPQPHSCLKALLEIADELADKVDSDDGSEEEEEEDDEEEDTASESSESDKGKPGKSRRQLASARVAVLSALRSILGAVRKVALAGDDGPRYLDLGELLSPICALAERWCVGPAAFLEVEDCVLSKKSKGDGGALATVAFGVLQLLAELARCVGHDALQLFVNARTPWVRRMLEALTSFAREAGDSAELSTAARHALAVLPP